MEDLVLAQEGGREKEKIVKDSMKEAVVFELEKGSETILDAGNSVNQVEGMEQYWTWSIEE